MRMQVAAKLEQGLAVANAALAPHSSSSSSSSNTDDDAAAAAAVELPTDVSSQPDATDSTLAAAAAVDTAAAAVADSSSVTATDKNYYGANGVPAMPAFARDINVVLGVPHRVWGKDITGNTLTNNSINCDDSY
jgi:hypothetical protein